MSAFEFEVFYDGDCPLCVREINMLRKLDRRGAIRFTDIAAPTFDPATTGLSMATLMDRIHGRLPSGELVEGVEVFRRLYGAVGLGFLLAWTRWPGLRAVADWGYRMFAKNRLRLTGRCVKNDEGVCTIAEHRA
jgi:predicted DCC family thiol-disulfide oxidoreductase YuxK